MALFKDFYKKGRRKIEKLREGRKKRRGERRSFIETEQKPDAWQKICNDPKYYQNLPEEEKKKIPSIQQGLYYELNCLDFEGVLDKRKTMDELLQEAEESKKNVDELAKVTELQHAEAEKLKAELEHIKKAERIDEIKAELGRVTKTELENTEKSKTAYSRATELYRQLATLGLLKQEIRLKVDPKAPVVDLDNVRAYLTLVKELGYSISYGTTIGYTAIAREIASDKIRDYQPKVVEEKKETGQTIKELGKK